MMKDQMYAEAGGYEPKIKSTLTVGSLFTGIGGFDLGLERAGMSVQWQVEIDPYCNKILEKHWPKVKRYGDIRKLHKKELGHVDVVAGGFPCPAFSRVGKRGGFDQDDLMFEMLRIIDGIKPRYALFENVEGFKPWAGSLRHEIKNIGYEYSDLILDARDFGIPQARRRYFGLGVSRRVLPDSQYIPTVRRGQSTCLYGVQPYYNNSEGRWTSAINTKEEWRAVFAGARRCRVPHGIPHRMDRLRGLGNAVVPQVAEYLGRMVVDFDARVNHGV